jgi:hypothetical protein
MLIMQVYHDSGHKRDSDRIRDFGCMPDSDRKICLWSMSQLGMPLLTLVAHHDTGQ